MIRLELTIKRFGQQGEKTGWTYVQIPASAAVKLNPESRKAFRVKGRMDDHPFKGLSLIPMGEGDYILAINASLRKAIGKQQGARLSLVLERDLSEPKPPAELMECLADEPEALERFKKLPKGHQNYFSNWIKTAKTEATRTRRIAACINALMNGWNFGQMMRAMKENKIS